MASDGWNGVSGTNARQIYNVLKWLIIQIITLVISQY